MMYASNNKAVEKKDGPVTKETYNIQLLLHTICVR